MNLDEEVRLYSTNADRERTENLATLYSIIVSLEYLERAYVRDSVTGKEWAVCYSTIPLTRRYAPACIRLLAQYKSLIKLLGEDLGGIGGVETFMKRYKMDHPAALHRLQVGVPATVEHSAEASEGGAEMGKWVAETTQVGQSTATGGIKLTEQSFITFMDALKLNLRAKDQLHPFLTELMSGYSRFKGSQGWEGRAKILHWWVELFCTGAGGAHWPRLITLNAMKASDEITEEQSRQVSSIPSWCACLIYRCCSISRTLTTSSSAPSAFKHESAIPKGKSTCET